MTNATTTTRPRRERATRAEPIEQADVGGFLACTTAVRLVRGYDAMLDLFYAVGLMDLGKQYGQLGTKAFGEAARACIG